MASVNVLIERDVEVPMRDGAVLRATVFRPDDDGEHPVLLLRTPYGRDSAATTHTAIDPERAAASGHVVVIQDVRGRFGSDGASFDPYVHEFDDGYDSVQWAAGIPGADGRVATYGISYAGTAAWQAAAATPPALRAVAAAQSTNDAFLDLSWRGGAFNWGMHLTWVLGTLALAQQARDGGDGAVARALLAEVVTAVDAYERTAARLPPDGLAVAARVTERVPFLADAMAHDRRGAYHRARSVAGRYGAITAPAFVVAGWYDVMLSNDLRHFAAIRSQARSAVARERSRLVIGPWTHGPGMLAASAGEVSFGIGSSGAALDLHAMLVDWLDEQLGRREPIEHPPVRVFVMGANRWRAEDAWPPPDTREQRWFLHGEGRLSLEPPGQETPPARYLYDPADPCPTVGGPLLMPDTYRRGPVDQTPILGREDVLTFTSDVLNGDLEIAGPVGASLYAATSAVDTDWVVKLCELLPDGRTINLCDGILRARFRGGDWSAPEPVRPDEVLRYEVDLWATAVVVPAGHRLRVLVTSSDFPRYDRNPNTGIVGVRATRLVSAEQRVFRDTERPSHVTLRIRGRD